MADLKKKKGFGLIEALFGITITATLLLAFTTLNINTIKISEGNVKELKALLYAKELIEIGKELEQSPIGWNKISDLSDGANCNKHFYPKIDSSDPINLVWKINNPGEENLEQGSYSRWITVENIYRNHTAFPNEISSVGCLCGPCGAPASDPYAKKITARVEWSDRGQTKNVTLDAYLYNY